MKIVVPLFLGLLAMALAQEAAVETPQQCPGCPPCETCLTCEACPTCPTCPPDLKGDLKSAQGKLATLTTTAATCDISLSSTQETLSSTQSTLAALKTTEAGHESASKKASAEHATCTATLAQVTSTSSQLESSTTACTAKLTDTESTLALLKTRADQCATDLSSLQSSLDSSSATTAAQVDKLQATLDATRAKQMSSEDAFNECAITGRKLVSDKEHAEAKIDGVKAALQEEIKAITEKLLTVEGQRDAKDKQIKDLNKDIADTKKDYQSATARGKGIFKYCNFTLMGEDAEITYNATRDDIHKTYATVSTQAKVQADLAVVATKAFAEEARAKASVAYQDAAVFATKSGDAAIVYYDLARESATIIYDQAHVAASPYVAVAKTEATNLYDLHVKEHVDAKITPVYVEHVSPHVAMAVAAGKAAYADALPVVEEIKLKSMTNAKHAHKSVVTGLEEGSRLLLEKLPAGGNTEGVESVIKFVGDEAEYVVKCILYAIGAFFVLKYGFTVVRIALRVCVVWPFKICFWPFFFGGGKKSGKGAKKAAKSKDEKKKGKGKAATPE